MLTLLRVFGERIFFSVIVLLLSFTSFSGYALSQQRAQTTRVYIAQDNSGWSATHRKVDGLFDTEGVTSDKLTILINLSRNRDGKFFKIMSDFKDGDGSTTFSPSRVTVRLADGTVLRAKGLACSIDILKSDLFSLRSCPPSKEPVFLQESNCSLLFFDHLSPPDDQEIVMYMNDSLASGGHSIEVPPIFLRKAERKSRLGLFQ